MFSLKLKGVSKVGIVAIGGLISAILGALLGWILFPILIDLNIDKQIVLIEGSATFEYFVNIPQPLLFKVFIFNVTNPKEVIDGGVPQVKEVGPYIYQQWRTREIDGFSSDKRFVTYRGIQKFIFDEEASAPLTEHDDLVVLNVPLNCVLQIAEYGLHTVIKKIGTALNNTLEGIPIINTIKHVVQSRYRSQRKSIMQVTESTMLPYLAILNGQLKEVFGEKYTSIVMTVKPSDLLFHGIPLCVGTTGIAEIICSVIKKQKTQALKEMEDGSLRFSLFGHKNMTDDGLFEIYTGVGDVSKLGLIRNWNKRKSIKTWLNATDGRLSTCNMINGTDTTIYAPHIKAEGYMYIFATDICRSVRMYYKEKVRFAGIGAIRFEVRDDFLKNIGPQYGNECYCIDKISNIPMEPNGCLYKGALDLSTCQECN